MQLLSRDAHFGAESQLSPVDKTRGGIHQHGGRVHSLDPGVDVREIFSEDGFAVTGPVPRDVVDRFIERVHYLDGQYQVQELARKVILRRHRGVRDDLTRPRIGP